MGKKLSDLFIELKENLKNSNKKKVIEIFSLIFKSLDGEKKIDEFLDFFVNLKEKLDLIKIIEYSYISDEVLNTDNDLTYLYKKIFLYAKKTLVDVRIMKKDYIIFYAFIAYLYSVKNNNQDYKDMHKYYEKEFDKFEKDLYMYMIFCETFDKENYQIFLQDILNKLIRNENKNHLMAFLGMCANINIKIDNYLELLQRVYEKHNDEVDIFYVGFFIKYIRKWNISNDDLIEHRLFNFCGEYWLASFYKNIDYKKLHSICAEVNKLSPWLYRAFIHCIAGFREVHEFTLKFYNFLLDELVNNSQHIDVIIYTIDKLANGVEICKFDSENKIAKDIDIKGHFSDIFERVEFIDADFSGFFLDLFDSYAYSHIHLDFIKRNYLDKRKNIEAAISVVRNLGEKKQLDDYAEEIIASCNFTAEEQEKINNFYLNHEV